MKKTFIILTLLLSLSSCLEKKEVNKDEFEERLAEYVYEDNRFDPIAYISNPKKTDTICISEISKAKNDIKKEGISFIQEVGFSYGINRYNKELKELCKQKGLIHKIEFKRCMALRLSCYSLYMDKALMEKFGTDFKEKMHKEADSLFLINAVNKTISYGDLDDRPRLPNEKERKSNDLGYVYVQNPEIKIESTKWDELPFMDIDFVVHKDSTISDFNVNNFVARGNDRFKKELFNLTVNKIKTDYPIWIPGSIKGIPLKSNNNVRVHFIKK